MTTAVRPARPDQRRPAARTLSYNRTVGVLTITQGKEEKSYYLDTLKHDGPPSVKCVRLSKLPATREEGEPDEYDIEVNTATRVGACECKGFLRWNKPCRHIAAVLVLADRGAI